MSLRSRSFIRVACAGLVAAALAPTAACGRLLPTPALPSSSFQPMACPAGPSPAGALPPAAGLPPEPAFPAAPELEAPPAPDSSHELEPEEGWAPGFDGGDESSAPPPAPPSIARPPAPPAPTLPGPPAMDDVEPGAAFGDSDGEG